MSILFDQILSVPFEYIEHKLASFPQIPWQSFYLNPRRLRGSDFLMRWSQGVWSEKRLVQGVNATEHFLALPYGPSSVAPEQDVRAFELYFELLDQAGNAQLKRPDLLIFNKSDQSRIYSILEHIERENQISLPLAGAESQGMLNGQQLLPFISESTPWMRELLSLAIIAVECENSLWKAKMMPDFQKPLKPQKRLGGRLGMAKTSIIPTIIIKDEDLKPLLSWQQNNRVQIHVWHVFYDLAYGISLESAMENISSGLVQPTQQTYQAPNGVITTKSIYKFGYYLGYPLGESTSEPNLHARFIVDKNGHILPFVHFEGGDLQLSREAIKVLVDQK